MKQTSNLYRPKEKQPMIDSILGYVWEIFARLMPMSSRCRQVTRTGRFQGYTIQF